jgi:AcrR family transcriptional regulator
MTDRRTERTRRLIAQALISLMLEKSYNVISVQDIVDRANVGRSTFYAHYQDKDALLSSEFERLVAQLTHNIRHDNPHDQSLLPSLELFRHVQQHYQLYKAVVIWGYNLDFATRALQNLLTATIEDQLSRLGQHPSIPAPVISSYVAGAFLTLLRWWLDNNMLYSPERMDEMFQRLVLPGVHAAFRGEM